VVHYFMPPNGRDQPDTEDLNPEPVTIEGEAATEEQEQPEKAIEEAAASTRAAAWKRL
jgi:hypothetical protein